MNIRLEMDLFKNNKNNFTLDEYSAYIYVSLLIDNKGYEKEYTYTSLFNIISSNTIMTSKIISNIKKGIDTLVTRGLITCVNIGKKLKITPLYTNTKGLYFYVPLDYIMKIGTQNNCVSLLYYFLYLCSTINIKTKYGFTSQNTISEWLGISRSTQIRRNKLFMELGVMNFEHRDNYINRGEFVNQTNMYYLPINKNVVDI